MLANLNMSAAKGSAGGRKDKYNKGKKQRP